MKKINLPNFTLVLITLALLITGLVLAKTVLIPIAISFFFAYLIYPIVARIEQWGVHRGLASLLVIALAILIVGAVVLLIVVRVSNLNIDLVQVQEQMNRKLDPMMLMLEQRIGLNNNSLNEALGRLSESFFSSWETRIGTLFAATTTTLFQLFLLPVYTFFLLFYRSKTAHFIIRLVKREERGTAVSIMRDVSKITTRYMGGVLMVIAILAVLNSVGLLIIGVDHAILFGTAAAVLNLIPYVGAFVGGLAPIAFVFFSEADPFATMLKVFLLFAFVQFLENNLITPGIVGNNIKINPFAIIFGLLMANLIWGIGGMLIVVPFLAIMKVIMRNVDGLRPFAYLISDRGPERQEGMISRIKRLFSRAS